MRFEDRLPLSAEEKKYESAEYYDRKPREFGKLENELLEIACPMPADMAIPAENWLDMLKHIDDPLKMDFGYAMLDDRRGYFVNYLYWNGLDGKATQWWYRWINIKPRTVDGADGSLHYKIWYPGEHIDHGYINGKDRSGGYYALDYNAAGEVVETRRFNVNPIEFGIPQEIMDDVTAQGYFIDCAWESGEGGLHLSLNVTHRLSNGDTEKWAHNWIGWGIRDGKLFKDPDAACTESLLKSSLRHVNIEGRYLEKLLPELYERFGNQPEDAV